MPEDLTIIAREAKIFHQRLKELLKSKEPYDRDVEFQRKNLRRHHLVLLLLYPSAKESKDVETALWMQTSYALISAYKHRITAIDRTIQANVVPRQSDSPKQQNQKHHGHGPIEYRKVLQRFRQFLAEEEKFWIQLVLRMHRAFGLTEADQALTALGLLPDTTTADGNSLFPQDRASITLGEKGNQLSTMSKALICLGDIARYRELYNESGGRPKAGQEAGAPARRGKIRRRGAPGIEAAPMARNYDRAQLRYEQARLLVPLEGNASHQLAIVATYLPDALLALMHYYRSLCVKQPYEPAADNMVTHITKTLQQWNRSREERDQILFSPPVSVQNQVDILKNRLVVLHACWQKSMEREAKEQERRLSDDFQRLVGERNLPWDLICTIIVVSQGGLWKHWMVRDGNTNAQSRREVARTPEANTTLEWRIYHHLLDMHMALLDVGKDELKDVPLLGIEGGLAQRITATFRRTLPALRIASKWLRANLNYMMQDPEFKSQQQKAKSRRGKVLQKTRGKLSGDSTHTIRFWNRYSQFATALAQAFPEAHLIPLSHPLEEDIDMRGFLPLKMMMGEGVSAKDRTSEAHPNEEQLMRISDLLSDAKALASMEDSPLLCENGVYQLKRSVIESPSRPSENGRTPQSNSSTITPPVPKALIMEETMDDVSPATPKEEDAMTEVTSRTDDDIVNDAFKHVGFGPMDDDEDEDQIVWNPKASSPTLSPLIQASPITPIKSSGNPIGNGYSAAPLPHQSLSPKQALKTPIGSPRVPVAHPVTAQDLLQNVMSVGRKPGASIGALESPRVAPLLFGSDLSHQASIWSASRDEQLKFGGGSNQLGIQTSPRSFPHSLSAPQETLSAPSTWSSQTMHAASSPFQIPGNMHHQASHSGSSSLSPLQNGVAGLSQHHRVSSLSYSLTPHLSPNKQYDGGNMPFGDPAIQAIALPASQFQQHQAAAPQPFVQHQQHPLPSLSQYYDAPIDQGYSGGYPSHSSLHDRARSASQSYMTSPLWGKIG